MSYEIGYFCIVVSSEKSLEAERMYKITVNFAKEDIENPQSRSGEQQPKLLIEPHSDICGVVWESILQAA